MSWGFCWFAWVWPFVLHSSSFPPLVSFYFPFGCSHFVKSLSVTSRLVSVAVLCFGRVGLGDPEARFFSLLGHSHWVEPVLLALRCCILILLDDSLWVRPVLVDLRYFFFSLLGHSHWVEPILLALRCCILILLDDSLWVRPVLVDLRYFFLLCFLQWAALWHPRRDWTLGLKRLDSVTLLAFFFLLLALASFLLHHFHILRLSFPHKISWNFPSWGWEAGWTEVIWLVSSPWRVGLIAAAATSSRRRGPWPGPNTSWFSSSWLSIFLQVEL